MIELEQCPFCGSKEAPKLIARMGHDGWRDRFCVLCDYNEGGCGAESGWYHYPGEAIESWNRRCHESTDVRENKHGKWIKYPSGELICSNCGHRRYKGNLYDDRQHWFALPKFCEVCGTIMDGGDEP